MSYIPPEVSLKPLTEYEDFITKIRGFGQELSDDINNGIPPNQAIGQYNEKLDILRVEFVEVRFADYLAVRTVKQMPLLEVSKDAVWNGEPRRTNENHGVYVAPEDMVFDSYDPGEHSSKGDCHFYTFLSEDNKKFTIKVTARALHKPPLRESKIILNPIIVWKLDPEEGINYCKEDFETLERLADDRYYRTV
ncbi:hypothetical protein [Bacillus safensis]|uniref:hypothetical protein n=1 Tax=Bacillus safensis TaxID=561879 RepID=UPI000B42F336|nr:hypothetical protein [Bacillus safensis]UDB49870.1 hypothetical protein BWL10_11010 [Bacillus safensis]